MLPRQWTIEARWNGFQKVNELPMILPFSLSTLEHGAFVATGLLIYVVVTRISQQRRYPSSAIAWVIGIAAVPYLGVPLFLIFGTRKVIRPVTSIRATFVAPPASDVPDWAARLLTGLNVAPAAHNNTITFHPDGLASYRALIELIESAQAHIEVCTFILGSDTVGNGVGEQLIAAVGRGVRVRLLLDAVGTVKMPKRMLRRLQAGGIDVRHFMPLLHNLFRGHTNLRNHRKLAIADGKRIWAGGRNLADEYFLGRPHQPAWVDLSFEVAGHLAGQAQAQFEMDWRAAGGHITEHSFSAAQTEPLQAGEGPLAQWIASGPDYADDTVYSLLVAGFYRAQNSILLVTPYFVPDAALLDALCLACRRGVQVNLVMPTRSNHRLADMVRERALRQFSAAGGKVHLVPSMVHAKAVVIDAAIALCGSVNLDSRSLFLNYEEMTAFYGAPEIAWLTAWINHLSSQGTAYEARRPTWYRDVLEGIVRAVGFQL
jgi:cardiolipin synthase